MSSTSNSCCNYISQRWVFTILASTGLGMQTLYAVILSITIIEMVDRTENLREQDDESCPEPDNPNLINQTFTTSQLGDNDFIGRYPWDGYTQGIILSSFSWSSMIAQFFYGTLAERFGGKHILGFAILGQAVLTFATPFVVYWGDSTALIINRVAIGLATDGMFSVVSTMIPHWSTPLERTRVGNAVYAGVVLGLFFGTIMPAPIMVYSGRGWPAVFYFFGMVGTIWFALWQTFVYENPEIHPFISDEEFEYLRSDSVEKKGKKPKLPRPPWKDIFLCKEFWAYTISYMGCNCTYYVVLSSLPRYMGNVVKFPIESIGYFSSLPYIFMWLNSLLSAWISDKILEKEWMSLTNVRKLLTTVSVTGPGIFLVLASYAECNTAVVVVMFMIGIALVGGVFPSMCMNPMDMSPNYAGSINSVSVGMASIVAILGPYLIGVLAPNSTLAEWRVVFWMILPFSSCSCFVYLFWFRAVVQPWNEPGFVKKETKIVVTKEEVELMQMS